MGIKGPGISGKGPRLRGKGTRLGGKGPGTNRKVLGTHGKGPEGQVGPSRFLAPGPKCFNYSSGTTHPCQISVYHPEMRKWQLVAIKLVFMVKS